MTQLDSEVAPARDRARSPVVSGRLDRLEGAVACYPEREAPQAWAWGAFVSENRGGMYRRYVEWAMRQTPFVALMAGCAILGLGFAVIIWFQFGIVGAMLTFAWAMIVGLATAVIRRIRGGQAA